MRQYNQTKIILIGHINALNLLCVVNCFSNFPNKAICNSNLSPVLHLKALRTREGCQVNLKKTWVTVLMTHKIPSQITAFFGSCANSKCGMESFSNLELLTAIWEKYQIYVIEDWSNKIPWSCLSGRDLGSSVVKKKYYKNITNAFLSQWCLHCITSSFFQMFLFIFWVFI